MSSQTFAILGDTILGALIEDGEHFCDSWNVVPKENTLAPMSTTEWNTTSYFFLASYDWRSAKYESKVGGDLSERIDDRR
jgi:hypothetical protein